MTRLQKELQLLLRNDRQREAYLCDDNCVVQAGPGSGKTATLTLKVLRLLHEKIPPPQGLACITYNNEAVREFRNRLGSLGLAPRMNVFLGTVHSFCLACVVSPYARLFRPDLPQPLLVASDATREACLRKGMDRAGVSQDLWGFRSRFECHRRTYLDRTDARWIEDQECADAIVHYEALLRSGGYVDFDDLVLISLQLIESQPFVRQCLAAKYPWLVVDEYQDLGYPLHRIVLSLVEEAGVKLFAVGDPDQSIYGFTGADPKHLQELASRSDMTPVLLRLNYRCGQKIIDGSEVILDASPPRQYKSARDDGEPGEISFIQESGGLEAQVAALCDRILPSIWDLGYEPKETAILYLDRNDAGVAIKALQERGIRYTGTQDQRYKRTPVTRWLEDVAQWCCGTRGHDGPRFRDIADFWLELLHHTGSPVLQNDTLEHMRLLFGIVAGLQNGEAPLIQWFSELDAQLSLRERLARWSDRPDEITACDQMFAACEEGRPLEGFTLADLAGCGPNSNVISLTTLHSSKGLEFDVVIMLGLEEGRLPSWGATSDAAVAEARRTFYVGLTRARHLVHLLYSGWYVNRWGTVYDNGPSRFVLELQDYLAVTE